MIDDSEFAPVPAPLPAASPAEPPPARDRSAAARSRGAPQRALWVAILVLALASLASLAFAIRADQRGASLEQELVRRQQDGAAKIAESELLAKQAQEATSASTAKVALLEARVAEVAVQRGQLEDLIQSLSRSRDENLLTDVEAGIRVALQQSAITGSAEPLVATLKQSDERLSRYSQPRLEGVRRAIARDLDRVRAVGTTDVSALSIKLDEAIRMVDDLPLIAAAETRKDASARDAKTVSAASSRAASAAAAAPASSEASSRGTANAGNKTLGSAVGNPFGDFWSALTDRLGAEARALVRVTRIDHPEAVLLAPDQAFFLRENLKLRLLNARLALLSRQFDTAQADLQAAQTSLDRYFDRNARRTALASDLIRQVAAQARQVTVPRPDDTLAALLAAGGH